MANVDLRARLADVSASIAELERRDGDTVFSSRLKALEDVRWSIQRQLECIVYPVLSLPPEIVSNICLHCLPPVVPIDRRKATKTTLAPLLLLQICRTWREIALSTPHLWDSLHLRLATLRPETQKGIADWFSRAGSCPLTFSLCLRELWGTFAGGISGILYPLAPRLQSLYLEVSWRQFGELSDIGPFPTLEHLALLLPQRNYRPNWNVPLKLFSAAPRLRHIAFIGFARPSMFVLPRSEVSKMTCNLLTTKQCLDLLEAHPSLEELSASVCDDNSHPELITHSHLETLRLFSSSSYSSLRVLRLPALQNLRVSLDLRSDDGDYFPAFLASTSLRRFHTDNRITSLSAEWFATAMPGLVDIDLYDPEPLFLRDFFARLDRAKDSGFLPHLRTIVLRECFFELDASVLGALSSRCTAGDENLAVLDSFQQIWPKKLNTFPWDTAMLTACRELVERGMGIHVGSTGWNWV
ncbi:hypothetical protein C8F04DRAFT_1067615 [Mycena alexandri]|uniref:F-box domain-containing protein n=1 Tax=Mycena alexandri TaxID=1745969 RepID=A0AAD6TF49_9AGAR|nr:hypothetical protein C8F04DRAFT_1067615 [Mycena alexandri]